jgi:hypothetical protein
VPTAFTTRTTSSADPAAESPGEFEGYRLTVGLLLGAVCWPLLSAVLPALPAWFRFWLTLLGFCVGSGSLVAGALVSNLPVAERGIVLCAIGVGVAPLIADLMGRAGIIGVFPYVALAGGGIFVVRAWSGRRHAAQASSGWGWLLPVAVALATGAIVFQHRLLADATGITVFGDYDTVDLSYYAGITAELTHRVPPMAPFYSGHELNYSWYPQLLLALVHRFAGVPTLEIYFRHAWPALLSIGAAMTFVFVRSIASTRVALLATTLLLVGGDFSYVFVWLLQPTTYLFDWLLWPTNFLAPTMEVLHFSTWTPSLPILFGGLYAMARAERGPRVVPWLVLAALTFALLVQFKPFAFAVLTAALAASITVVRGGWKNRRQYARLLGLTGLFSAPFLYRIASLYSESRSHLRLDFFLLQHTMLEKLGLSERIHAAATRLAGDGLLHTVLVVAPATVLFFVGGLGVRSAGVADVCRVVDPRSVERPIWRFLGWTVVAGVAIPFVIVTEPYHDTLQFYQTALYVMWIFAARSILRVAEGSSGRGGTIRTAAIVGLALAAALPSSVHYLFEKHGDGPNHTRARLTRSEMAVADYLRTTDPERTVVLHDRPLEPSLIVIRSERRAVLAWAGYVTGSGDRRGNVDRFFASADRDPEVALEVLREYAVSHVIAHPDRDRVNASVLAGLKPVLTFPDVVLYEVPAGIQ